MKKSRKSVQENFFLIIAKIFRIPRKIIEIHLTNYKLMIHFPHTRRSIETFLNLQNSKNLQSTENYEILDSSKNLKKSFRN